MKRRDFLALAAAATAWPSAARARTAKLVGILFASIEADPEIQARLAVLREELAKLGWADGKDARLEPRWFGGDAGQAARYARDLVALNADVIVANSTLAVDAVLKATRSVPTVFVLAADPVGNGFVASLAHPGGSVTGFSAFDPANGCRRSRRLLPPSSRQRCSTNPALSCFRGRRKPLPPRSDCKSPWRYTALIRSTYSPLGVLYRSHPERREGGRPARPAADEIRVGH
jgi:putative ABC transport system substrate-binding protein